MNRLIYIVLIVVALLHTAIGEVHAQANYKLIPDEQLSSMPVLDVLYYLYLLDDNADAHYRSRVLRQLEFAWNKTIYQEPDRVIHATICVNKVGTTFHEYDLILRLLGESEHKPFMFSTIDKIFISKAQAIAHNKKGEYLASMKYFQIGLSLALELDSAILIRDMYHHLAHEYSLLSLEDSSLVDEYLRINDKIIYYNQILEDKASLSLNFVQALLHNRNLKQSRHQLRYALSQIPKVYKIDSTSPKMRDQKVLAEEYRCYFHNCLMEYAFIMMRNSEYRECIDILKKFDLQEKSDDPGLIYTLYAKSYYHLGLRDSAMKYALAAADLFETSDDQDEKRIPMRFLPEVLSGLNQNEEAFKIEQNRNEEIYRQFVSENIIETEEQRFGQELGVAKTGQKIQSSKNRKLWIGMGTLMILLAFVIYTIRAVQKRNRIIKEARKTLAANNEKLNIANKDLESFAYASAHDIKNPLNTVSGFLQLLQMDDQNKISAESKKYLEDIEVSIQNINSLINSILKYAQVNDKQTIVMQDVDLNQIIKEILTMLYAQIVQTKAQIVIPQTLPYVQGEPALLAQVIMNLVSNAIKYHRKGIPPILKITTVTMEDSIQLNFEDNGIGIPEDSLEKIFDLFSRAENSTSYDGVGVGLAVTKKIIGLLGGQIKVGQNREYGSTFSLILPSKPYTRSTRPVVDARATEKHIEINLELAQI